VNTLFLGDNLAVLRQHLAEAAIDLVYLDPPFQSGKDYRLASKAGGAERTKAEAEAFKDTWRWGPEAKARLGEITETGGRLATTLSALHSILGESDLMAYLCMMAPRLVELYRCLKPSGSLYLHCDPTASHYLKVTLDALFGVGCFRNEVIWRYRRWPARARRFQRMHDVLLFYTKGAGHEHTFETLYGYEKLADSTLKTFGTRKQRADFSSGSRKPSVEDRETQGPPLSDVWEIGVIAAIGKERTGYPTQKPEALLQRVLRASSREGDVVLDPFCGCGTTLAVAERLGRKWIGIDASARAIELVQKRLRDSTFELRGPQDPLNQPDPCPNSATYAT
jgi:site-specific DNA-methyltransferase (adenine-specific)